MRKVRMLTALLVVVLLAACTGAEDVELPEEGAGGEVVEPGEGAPPPVAALEAQQALAAQLGDVAVEDVQIVETEQVEWPDACLGLADAGEMCAQVITPGWRVVLEVNGQQYEARTDDTGQQVRIAR